MNDVKITESSRGLTLSRPGAAALREHFATEQKCEHGIPFIDLCIAAQYAAEQPATPTPSEVIDWFEAVSTAHDAQPARIWNIGREHFASAAATPTPSIEQIKAEAFREAASALAGQSGPIEVHEVRDWLNGWADEAAALASPVPEQPTVCTDCPNGPHDANDHDPRHHDPAVLPTPTHKPVPWSESGKIDKPVFCILCGGSLYLGFGCCWMGARRVNYGDECLLVRNGEVIRARVVRRTPAEEGRDMKEPVVFAVGQRRTLSSLRNIGFQPYKVASGGSVGQNRTITQEAGTTNGDSMAADITDPKTAYLVGALAGELSKQGVGTTPITDENGYTNELELRFQFTDRFVRARIRVEEIDFDSSWF